MNEDLSTDPKAGKNSFLVHLRLIQRKWIEIINSTSLLSLFPFPFKLCYSNIVLKPLEGIGDCQLVVTTDMEGLEAFSEVSKCIRCNY